MMAILPVKLVSHKIQQCPKEGIRKNMSNIMINGGVYHCLTKEL